MARTLEDHLNSYFGIGDDSNPTGNSDLYGDTPRASAGPVASAKAPTPSLNFNVPGQTGSYEGNPDYSYKPGFGYTYNGYNPSTGGITGTPSVSVPINGVGGATGASNDFGGPQNGDYQSWFYKLFPGNTLSPDMLAAQEGTLGKYGIRVNRNARGQATDITLPGGQVVDVIQGAGSGLNQRQWLTGGGSGGGSVAPGSGEFSDPWGSTLESYISKFLQENEAQKATNKQRAQGFADTLRTRETQLNQAPYTAGDEAVMRAKAFDQLERRRQQTLKNARENVYARGFAPTSGLVQDAENNVNTNFEQARTGIESNLLNTGIQEGQRRKDEAVQLEGLAQQALNGGDVNSLQNSVSQLDAINRVLGLESSRTRDALSTLGMGGGTNDPLSTILGLLNYGNQTRALDNQQSQTNMQGLGSLLPLLLQFIQ